MTKIPFSLSIGIFKTLYNFTYTFTLLYICKENNLRRYLIVPKCYAKKICNYTNETDLFQCIVAATSST